MNQESILIIVQRDGTQNSLFIILQVHSTCFGCQPHPSSGIHKTVTTASGTVQLPPSNVAKLAWPRLLTALILRFLVFWIKEKSSQGRLWMINLNRLHHSNSVEQTSLKTSQLPGYSRKSLLFTKPNFFYHHVHKNQPLVPILGHINPVHTHTPCSFNPLTHNDPYSGRTAPLTSKVAFYIFIQQI
jgi:hypothetical protein